VRRASEEIGFFYLAGHGVPTAVSTLPSPPRASSTRCPTR
jgi:hypothetical protein